MGLLVLLLEFNLLRPRRRSHGEGCQARRFLHADYGGQEFRVEIPESGDEALGDSIALWYEQGTGPRANILRDDHVDANSTDRHFDGLIPRDLKT
jgi:hypothetical protein